MKFQDGSFYSHADRLAVPLAICILYLTSCFLALPSLIMMIASVLYEPIKSATMAFPFMILSQVIFITFLTLTCADGRSGAFMPTFIPFSTFYLNFGFLITIANIMIFIGPNNDMIVFGFAATMYLLQLAVVIFHSFDSDLHAGIVGIFSS